MQWTPLFGAISLQHTSRPEKARESRGADVRAANPLLNGLLRVLRPFLVRSLQGDLDEYVKAATQTRA